MKSSKPRTKAGSNVDIPADSLYLKTALSVTDSLSFSIPPHEAKNNDTRNICSTFFIKIVITIRYYKITERFLKSNKLCSSQCYSQKTNLLIQFHASNIYSFAT